MGAGKTEQRMLLCASYRLHPPAVFDGVNASTVTQRFPAQHRHASKSKPFLFCSARSWALTMSQLFFWLRCVKHIRDGSGPVSQQSW